MLIGWIDSPSGCTARPAEGGSTRGVSAERFETPSCGGSRPLLAAWGEPARPGLPPEGETEKGELKFLAAAGSLPTRHTKNSTQQTSAGNSLRPLESRNSQIRYGCGF